MGGWLEAVREQRWQAAGEARHEEGAGAGAADAGEGKCLYVQALERQAEG